MNGFDVVVGNPPYGAKIEKKEKEYFKKNYGLPKQLKMFKRFFRYFYFVY